MSLGVGLLTFASLETVGIYFGLGESPPAMRLLFYILVPLFSS